MADGAEAGEWDRVYAVVRRWVDVPPEAVIPARYLPPRPAPPPRTEDQVRADTDAGLRLLGRALGAIAGG